MNSNELTFSWLLYARILRQIIFHLLIFFTILGFLSRVDSPFLLEYYAFLFILTLTYTSLRLYLFLLRVHRLINRQDLSVLKPDEVKTLDFWSKRSLFQTLNEFLNITFKKKLKSERRLERQSRENQALLDYIPDPIVICDEFMNLLQYNKTFHKLYNPQTLNDTKLWKVFEDDEMLVKKISKALDKEKTKKIKKHFDEKNKLYFDITIVPIIHDQEIMKKAILIIFKDMTESQLMEKMRVELATNISHEIKTPLTAISGYVQLITQGLKNKLDQDSLESGLAVINHNTKKINDLFESLMNLSLVESQYHLNFDHFNLEEMVSFITSSLYAKYPEKKYEIQFQHRFEESDSMHDLKPLIYADEKLFYQVMMNLLDNAIKYNDKDIAQVSIILETKEKKNHIIIRDNGKGASKEEAKRLFERFYRTKNAQSENKQGLGLGLSIVKHIVHKHEGSITVEQADKGLEFHIYLPRSIK